MLLVGGGGVSVVTFKIVSNEVKGRKLLMYILKLRVVP
jgi:hypothetical protein